MKALIINGPNLNMLGRRNKNLYGSLTLEEINQLIINTFPQVHFDFYQSNHEGEIIDLIQNIEGYDFLVINGGGFSHTSVAIRDALALLTIPIGVCHLTDITKRESFRQIDLFKDVGDYYIFGEKEKSYIIVIEQIIKMFEKEK